jgi:hypothetical protein
MIRPTCALACAATLSACAASRVEPQPQPPTPAVSPVAASEAPSHGVTGALIGGRQMGEGVALPPLTEGTSRSTVTGCLAAATQAEAEQHLPPPVTRSTAPAVTMTPFRGGVSVAHQLTHACCLKAQITTRIEGSSAVVLEKLTGSPCRCMCGSMLRTAIGLAPGHWTIAVDLEQDGRVEGVIVQAVDVPKI